MDQQRQGVPQQTDNRPREEDGEQDVSQDPELAYDELEEDGS